MSLILFDQTQPKDHWNCHYNKSNYTKNEKLKKSFSVVAAVSILKPNRSNKKDKYEKQYRKPVQSRIKTSIMIDR